MRMANLNDAKIIILDNGFCNMVVDKEKHNIVLTRQWNKEVNKDVTEMCEQMEREYTISDMVIETPYKSGVVMSKLLNNRIDRRCMEFINIFNVEVK